MLTRWNDLDRTFTVLDELRRRMDRLWTDLDGGYELPRAPGVTAPRASLYDRGGELLLQVELPGIPEDKIQVTVNQEVLTVQGERQPEVLQGYAVHRQERAPFRFARSFQLPCKIDPERVMASSKNGVLSITLAKAAESQPRSITVKANS